MIGLTFTFPLNEYSGYSHPYFMRDDQSQLALMTPTPSRARALKKRVGEEANGSGSGGKRIAKGG